MVSSWRHSNDNNFMNLELNFNRSQTTLGEDTGGPTPGQSDQATQKRIADVFHIIDQAVARVKTHPYQSPRLVLLTRQLIPGETTSDQHWPITDFTLAMASTVTCGSLLSNNASNYAECLTYLVPHTAILLTPNQSTTLLPRIDTNLQGFFQEQGHSYTVMLRSLLPDEGLTKGVLLSGSFSAGSLAPSSNGAREPVSAGTLTPEREGKSQNYPTLVHLGGQDCS